MTDTDDIGDSRQPVVGHNSANFAGSSLRAYVHRVERLREEIQGMQGDVAQVYAEAKASGFDVKTMKKLIAERARDQAKVEDEMALLEVYRAAMEGDDPPKLP